MFVVVPCLLFVVSCLYVVCSRCLMMLLVMFVFVLCLLCLLLLFEVCSLIWLLVFILGVCVVCGVGVMCRRVMRVVVCRLLLPVFVY